MAGEPDLHPSQSGEWVQYLQQLMSYYGFWTGPENGEFGDELADAVRAMQTQYHLTADGVVRADTWALLTGGSSQASDGGAQGGTAQSGDADALEAVHHGAGGATPHDLHDTGAQATEEPASYQVGGLPAFRYALPAVPLAEATFDIGEAAVTVQLTLTGSVTITCPHATPGVTTTVNDQTWRVAAAQSLHGLTSGIQMQGIGGESVSLSSTFGNQFEQTEFRFTNPATMSFIGRCNVACHVETDAGYVTVQGSPGFQLDVTVVPHPSAPSEPEVNDEHSWLSRYAPAIEAAGVIVLVVAVAIAAAPETGGGSLVLISEAAELGGALAY